MSNFFEGPYPKKPADFRVTAMIPVIGLPDCTELVVELLRLQTVRPFIVLVDTGSEEADLRKHLAMRAEDMEVHSLRFNGVTHGSMIVSSALDLAWSACQTEWAFLTHQDCWLRRRDVIERFIALAAEHKTPVVGYQLSPRAHDDWRECIGHTCTLFHIPTMHKIGATWCMRRTLDMYGIGEYGYNPKTPNWPDTETTMNLVLKQNEIKPYLVGGEKNFQRNVTEDFDHVRSLPSSRLCAPAYYAQASLWVEDAKREARKRIEHWSKANA